MLKPDQIPQFTGDLAQLETDHADLKKDAANVRTAGGGVHSQFQGLSAYYTAPEAEQLFATTKPVKERADTFADDLETVSGALSSYATEIRPLVDKLKQLKADATAFLAMAAEDDEWQYDGDKVDEHNQIRDDITATVAAFWAAERTAHNKITALWGGTQMVAGDGSEREDQYGFAAEDMKDAQLPWGDPVEEKHHWWEIGYWLKSFFWDGLIVDGIWGTIKGIGTLLGFNGLEAMGQAWKGLGQLVTGLVVSVIPGAGALFWTLPDDKLPSWLRDSRTAMKETGKALVAWDQWGENPARAAGLVTFNVLTTVFTGGAGAAAAGVTRAGAVAKVLSVAGRAGRIIDPMTYIAKGAGAGLSKIGDIIRGLRGVGHVDIPTLPDNAVTLPEGSVTLPDGTVRLPEGAAVPEGATTLPDGSVRLPEGAVTLPEGTIDLGTPEGAPAQYLDGDGNLLDSQGSVVQHADQAPVETVVDTADEATPTPSAGVSQVDAPLKEPALVGAGAGDNAASSAGHSAGSEGVPSQAGDGSPGGSHAGDSPAGGHGDDVPPHGDDVPARGDDAPPHGDGADNPTEPHADDGVAPATDEAPPKAPGGDEPPIIRQDDDFSATHNQYGLRKSRFDPDTGIVPADPDGKITPLEHVLGGANPKAKESSQFTSFAPKDGTGKVYGAQEVSIDYRRLQADIDAGKVQNVEILRPEQIQQSISDDITKTAGKDVEVPPTLKPTDTDAVTKFVNDLGLSKGKTSKVHRRVMALLNTRRDGEWLISGIVPKDYVTGPYPTTKTP
ncbi:hypothetical protein [Streptomyces sp. NBC_01373]|uniref:hypothetical protein n=1 Tax=Streptomyces sp. NBC_01373 TaxID=2903843 RepID=UPI002250FECF|nr:hypothetical protein [Streptomyces sp. NBC_01373]MCX4700734.1 hypothetical protein [Streptomyces sp. NBC_01373]